MMRPYTRNNHAFTLIELSIVLVIIGLIIGGVLTGQSLIKQAEIRATISQKNEFLQAIYTFRNKYNCFPGDCVNITNFFSAKSDCIANTGLFISGNETCNGDGNGILFNQEEGFLWNHLYLANLINKRYIADIVFSSDPHDTSPETSLPQAKIKGNVYFSLVHPNTYINNTSSYNSIFYLGGWPSEDLYTYLDTLPPQIAQAIDFKIDDGNPESGTVYPVTFYYNTCMTGSPARYDITNEDNKCALILDVKL